MRRVGVEIEFANESVVDAARLVQDLFGGHEDAESEHRVLIKDTQFGDFVVELDWQGAHKKSDTPDFAEPVAEAEKSTRAFLGRAVSGLVPTEVVCPPVPWNRLDALNPLFDELRRAGAEGTEGAPIYGFGLHLNPEVAEETADYALRHLQAYAILEEWLRAEIDIDMMRRLLPHIDPFPPDYLKRILRADYNPNIESLIRDYVEGNQTRNRGLDMTPLFRYLDEDVLTETLTDASLVKARPTFHYRLPNARLSDAGWNAVVEWNRWLEVEALAEDASLLAERREAYVGWLDRPAHERWIETVRGWFA